MENLDALRNTDADMINETIPVIIQYLKTNDERVTNEELRYKKNELKTFDYNLDTPVYSIFDCIKAFQDL